MSKINMTNQEIFNRVVQHAKEQNCRAENRGGFCSYRTEEGLKCFVGCLIPDELYVPEMDQGAEGTGISEMNPKFELFPTAQEGLLRALQRVHDQNAPDAWIPRLRGLAKNFKLDASACDGGDA